MRASMRWTVTAIVGVLSCAAPSFAGSDCASGLPTPDGFPPCEICFTDVDGSPFCGQDLFCEYAQICTSDEDCPTDSRCARATCCGAEPICIATQDCVSCINPGVCFYYGECIAPLPCESMEFPTCEGGGCPEGMSCVADPSGGEQCTCDVPMLVVLESFRAEAVRHGIRVEWRTAIEVDTVAFRLLREVDVHGEKSIEPVTRQPIPARGLELGGAEYSVLDRSKRATPAARYYLEDIDLWGRVTRHGPAFVDAATSDNDARGNH